MITPKLKVRFRKPKRLINGVRLIAEVQSNTNPSKHYDVLFIDGTFHGRRKRTVVCPCNDFHFRKEGRLHSCIHTRNARHAESRIA